MAETIKINIPYVRTLHGSVQDTAERLRGHTGDVHDTLSSDPDVSDKLHDFMGKWDKRRGQVADTLDAVVSALHAIDESFTESDEKMAAQVDGGG
jgi:uncharacterized protein YukE